MLPTRLEPSWILAQKTRFDLQERLESEKARAKHFERSGSKKLDNRRDCADLADGDTLQISNC